MTFAQTKLLEILYTIMSPAPADVATALSNSSALYRISREKTEVAGRHALSKKGVCPIVCAENARMSGALLQLRFRRLGRQQSSYSAPHRWHDPLLIHLCVDPGGRSSMPSRVMYPKCARGRGPIVRMIVLHTRVTTSDGEDLCHRVKVLLEGGYRA